MYFFAFLDAELVAKGFTRTELMMLLRWGNSARARFLLCHFVGYQINGIQGIHFYAGDILPFCVCCY
jgi:hypothetical protein